MVFSTLPLSKLTTSIVLLPSALHRTHLHRAEFGTTRADFEKMTAEDFWETGASGRIYSRQLVLDVLEERFSAPHDDVWETSDFACRKLAENVCMLTYTLLQNRLRLTRRCTIWQKTPDGWKAVYHQGTIVQDV